MIKSKYRPKKGPRTPQPRSPKRDFTIGQDVSMISNPGLLGHVVGFDPDGSVMVQWSEGRTVTGVDPRNLRIEGRGYAGPHEARHYPKPQPPPRRFVSPRAQEIDRTSRGRFAGKRTPAPNPGMNPFVPQAQVRLENRWQLGDAGAIYEFNVKLYRVQSSATEEEWEQDRVLAVEEFETELRNRYPWIGEMYMTGRSAGWFAIEDPKGKMTKKTLETISGLVEAAKRRFVKDMEQAYPRKSTRR